MGWLILAVLAIATLVALALFARPGRKALELVAAMLLLAVVGYAWQGHPRLGGRPTSPRAAHKPQDVLFAEERKHWLDQVGPDAQALDTADSLIRNGDPDYAIAILRGELSRRPKSMILWIGLGNALVAYADGSVTPAARFAFARAMAIAPGHPAPLYFLALDYAQMGDLDTAEAMWTATLKAAPPDAPWRLMVAEKLMVLEKLKALR